MRVFCIERPPGGEGIHRLDIEREVEWAEALGLPDDRAAGPVLCEWWRATHGGSDFYIVMASSLTSALGLVGRHNGDGDLAALKSLKNWLRETG